MDLPPSGDNSQVTSSESIERNARPVVLLLVAAVVGALGFAWWLQPEPVAESARIVEGQPGEAITEPPPTSGDDSGAADPVGAGGRELPAQPPDRCQTLVGRRPRVTVRTPNPWISCIVVADFQQMVLWNNGTEPMSVDWPDGKLDIGVNQSVVAGWAGSTFPVGPSKVDSSPYLIPTIWLMPSELSPTADLVAAPDRFGPVVIGMTIDEAVAALGRPLEDRLVDGWPVECTFAADDPYSPIFVMEAGAAGSSTLVGVVDLKPGGAAVGAVDRCL